MQVKVSDGFKLCHTVKKVKLCDTVTKVKLCDTVKKVELCDTVKKVKLNCVDKSLNAFTLLISGFEFFLVQSLF